MSNRRLEFLRQNTTQLNPLGLTPRNQFDQW